MRRRVLGSAPSLDQPSVDARKHGRFRLTFIALVIITFTIAVIQFVGLHHNEDMSGSHAANRDDADSKSIGYSAAVFTAFRQEAMQCGVRLHANTYLGDQNSVGIAQRGIITQTDIDRKTTLVELPVACTISSAVARERSAYVKAALVAANASTNTLTSSMLLAIALAELFVRGSFSDRFKDVSKCDTLLSAYAADLKVHIMRDDGFPQHWGISDTPVKGDQLEMNILALANDTEVGLLLEQWNRETDVMFQHIEEGIGADVAAKEGLTREMCNLARLGVSSRAFAVPLPSSLDPEADFERQPALLPVIDLCNHDLPRPISPLITGQDVQLHSAFKALAVVKATKETVILKLTEPVASGHAISVSYGLHANSKMLVNYGFTMPWVGALTCLARGGLTLQAPDLPDERVWPSRCFETDTDVEKALRALRWRELLASGVEDLSELGCSALGKKKGDSLWQGCRKVPSARIELSTWAAFRSVVKSAQEKHHYSLSLADKCRTDTISASLVSACGNVARILEDELAVLKVLGDVSEAVGRECVSVLELEDIYPCVAQVRSQHALGPQWADAMFDGLEESGE